MGNTYTQTYVQIVFAVQGRHSMITESFRQRLEKYICGIIKNNESKPLAIYCNPDHTHILISLHPSIALSDLVREVKCNSSKWMNSEKFLPGKFSWQEGFGAFTYSKSQIDYVAKYILDQPQHHSQTTFREEYLALLKEFDVDYDERYIFK